MLRTEVSVGLTRAEVISLLDQHPDRYLASAEEKLRKALGADVYKSDETPQAS